MSDDTRDKFADWAIGAGLIIDVYPEDGPQAGVYIHDATRAAHIGWKASATMTRALVAQEAVDVLQRMRESGETDLRGGIYTIGRLASGPLPEDDDDA